MMTTNNDKERGCASSGATQKTDFCIHAHEPGYCIAAFYAAVFLALCFIGPVIVNAIVSGKDFVLPAPGLSAVIVSLSLLLMLFLLFKNVTYYYHFAKKPVLVFDERGIVDQTGPFSLGLIHWHEIEEIFCCEVYASGDRGTAFQKDNALGILVRDRDALMSRFGLLARFIIWRRSRPGFFIILTSGLQIYGNNVSALVLKAVKAFPVKAGEFRGVKARY